MSEPMVAFHGKAEVAELYRSRVAAHCAADELVRGKYWQGGKGCAVGCTIHSDDHSAYERELGIPQMLARLEDVIFEALPNGKAKEWPIRFLNAPRIGADLSRVGWMFLHWLLTQREFGAFDHPSVRDAVTQCARIVHALAEGDPIYASAALAAESAAAARAAESAAASSRAAESAAWAAESAAAAAARASESAAESAARAAETAAAAARASESAASASLVWAAETAAWIRMSDKLIELMEAA